MSKKVLKFIIFIIAMSSYIYIYAAEDFKKTGYIEAGVRASYLTNDYTRWFGQYIIGVLQSSSKNIWDAELSHDRRFSDSGHFFAIGNTHIFNDDWYTYANIGGSTSGDFWPKLRLNFDVNKKWLAEKQLITTIGITHYHQYYGYRDTRLYGGVAYHFTAPWILYAGVSVYHSHPGSAFSGTPFVALTQGAEKHHYLTLRYAFGREAYQSLDDDIMVNFPSQELSLIWRQWLTNNWGFNLIGELYHCPDYRRVGISFGIFRDF